MRGKRRGFAELCLLWEAPEAAAAPWPRPGFSLLGWFDETVSSCLAGGRMMAPQRLAGAPVLPLAVVPGPGPLQRASTTTSGHPAPPQPLQRASTTVTGAPVVLSRACTLTLPQPTAVNVPATPQAQAIVLQRTGTVTLAESTPGLTAQPAQLAAQPLQRAGTVTVPETAGPSASAAPMRVFSPAPATSIVTQVGGGFGKLTII